MKINKQLFEDVISGKLKGTFVLRDGSKIPSDKLRYDYSGIPGVDPPLVLNQHSYIYTGICFDVSLSLDIIDFIPDTDMKENELTIEIPDGKKIVDWDESKKQNKIVLKDKQLTYEDICKKLFKDDHYTIAWEGYPIKCCSAIYNASNATTEHQLECILAKNKLANVAKYLNNGWKPVYNVQSPHLNEDVWIISNFLEGIRPKEVMQNSCASSSGTVLFKSEEFAQQAIEILGEETVKLALEPLGI